MKAELQNELPKVRNAAGVRVLDESVPLAKENGGAIFRTSGDKAGELRYLQTMKSRNGVVLNELTAEQYAKAKGSVPEVEISQRQFEAANGVRLTADGKITTIEGKKLAKNFDSAQRANLREPRFVTPTTAEFIRKAEAVRGMKEVEAIRQKLSLTSKAARRQNVGFAEIIVNGQQTKQVGVSEKKKLKEPCLCFKNDASEQFLIRMIWRSIQK